MKKNTSHIIGLAFIVTVWAALSVWCFIKPADEKSISERRDLAKMPKFTAESVFSGKFMKDFESYTLDQFPMRDSFRSIKALSSLYIFGKKDNNNLFIHDGYIAKLEETLNEKMVNGSVDKLTYLYNTYVKDTEANVYFSVIPEKGYFLGEMGYPSPLDFDALVKALNDGMPFAEYIDITDTLSLDAYYKTDTHWRQDKIVDTANKICEEMGAETIGEHEIVSAYDDFHGVYYGQAALPIPPENISYVKNETLDSLITYNFENKKTYTGTNDFDKLSSKDPYEMFLSGAASVLKITNPNVKEEKTLVVFRDSFGSSLIPLLSKGYSEIIILDTRYIFPDLIGSVIDLSEADDVLFIYSSLLLNNSTTLRNPLSK